MNTFEAHCQTVHFRSKINMQGSVVEVLEKFGTLYIIGQLPLQKNYLKPECMLQ